MSEELIGNVLIAQSGKPTAVTNAILTGIITEALNHDIVEEIYGSLSGIAGILTEDFIDLAEESQQTIRGLRHTPGAALGSQAQEIKNDQELDRILRVLEAHNIRYFFQCGDANAQAIAHTIDKAAKERGYALRVIGIPYSIENNIAVTDHSAGFGSAAKFIATTVQQLAQHHQSQAQHDLVSIVEISGDNAGWLTASASLGKHRNRPDDAPHILCLPETPFSPSDFIDQVCATLKKVNYCLVVTGEALFDKDGNYLGSDSAGGRHGGADYLKNLITDQLSLQVTVSKLGTTQNTATYCASDTDNQEAFMSGQQAVLATIKGESGKMITLMRGETDSYAVETGLLPFEEASSQSKAFPADWINEDNISLRHPFYKYALPLIQGEVELPYENGVACSFSLSKNKVSKKLENYASV